MLKNIIKSINNVKKQLNSTEVSLEPCWKLVEQINEIKLGQLEDLSLKEMSMELKKRIMNGEPANDVLVEAYALVREASYRVLGMRHYDVQLLAGIAMHNGAMVEMQTGEGKTLAAVLPSYLNALGGKGVHILTFNDYLAQRDALWMGPVHEFLGLTVGFIKEGMSKEQRKKAYNCDITYLTAKEAGFDYLRGFLCNEAIEMIQRPFGFGIVDEGDSILIDEARIPLVIAGSTEREKDFNPMRIAEIIKSLEQGEDYSYDEYERNVFLTERGTNKIEKLLNCKNLYDERNLNLLVDVNNALHAEALLKLDVDYIIRNGKIELVDEFTGRVADKRQWPHGLQEAIEAKEGILSSSKGRILSSITLQNFIRLYPGICGMTGTVHPAQEEFLEFYGLNTAVIPTNRKCIREDHADFVFTHHEAKINALVNEICNVHKTGRPILIGTGSVGESEELAVRLEENNVSCAVLNAKNDALEAEIVARAGMLGAVTVSTNMAGRGTDIKLGGENKAEYEKIAGLGGLYVIGTNRHESLRIDNQLRGRAGRQGDPGSSRFFTSLEDDLMKQYRLKELLPERLCPKKQSELLNNPVIIKEINRAQRIIEGQNYDIRKTMSKYAILMENQRRMVFSLRNEVLFGNGTEEIFNSMLDGRFGKLLPALGEKALKKAVRQVLLYKINSCWAEFLEYLSYIRETIHLVNLAGKIPISEFNKSSIQAFEKMLQDIREEAIEVLEHVKIGIDGIDMEEEGMKAPSTTWTYLVDDGPEQLGIVKMSLAFDPISIMLMGVSMSWHALKRIKGRSVK